MDKPPICLQPWKLPENDNIKTVSINNDWGSGDFGIASTCLQQIDDTIPLNAPLMSRHSHLEINEGILLP